MTDFKHTIRQPKRIKPLALEPFNLHQSYRIGPNLTFLNFNDLDPQQALDVLRWRNHEQVRKNMFTKEVIPIERHFEFLKELPLQSKRFYWVIVENGQHLGVIDLTDYQGLKSEWGFYLSPDFFGKGKAINFLFHALNFFFHTLGFEQLYGFCNYKNIRALLFHDLFGIKHQGYIKKKNSHEESWYSHRIISAKNWYEEDLTLKRLNRKLKIRKATCSLEEEKLLLDQLALEALDANLV